jgi:hypothetical protein
MPSQDACFLVRLDAGGQIKMPSKLQKEVKELYKQNGWDTDPTPAACGNARGAR